MTNSLDQANYGDLDTVSGYLNNGGELTVDEMKAVLKALDIKVREPLDIWFVRTTGSKSKNCAADTAEMFNRVQEAAEELDLPSEIPLDTNDLWDLTNLFRSLHDYELSLYSTCDGSGFDELEEHEKLKYAHRVASLFDGMLYELTEAKALLDRAQSIPDYAELEEEAD